MICIAQISIQGKKFSSAHSFQWLPTDLLLFHIFAFFLFKIRTSALLPEAYGNFWQNFQRNVKYYWETSKEQNYYRLQYLFQRENENILLVLVKIEGFGGCNN